MVGNAKGAQRARDSKDVLKMAMPDCPTCGRRLHQNAHERRYSGHLWCNYCSRYAQRGGEYMVLKSISHTTK